MFAGLRERAGWGEREVEVSGGRLGDVWAALGLGEEPAGLLYAVNQEYAERDRELAEGDEVAVIPPVSGGAFRLVDGPIDLAAVIAEVEDEQAGAIATFQGTVRRQSRGRTVIALEYEAYCGMAEKVMAEIAEGVKSRYELCEVAVTHRVGHVRGRRGVRRDRGVGSAPTRRALSVPRRHRRAEGTSPALEEGALRGRRGMDRPRLVSEPSQVACAASMRQDREVLAPSPHFG